MKRFFLNKLHKKQASITLCVLMALMLPVSHAMCSDHISLPAQKALNAAYQHIEKDQLDQATDIIIGYCRKYKCQETTGKATRQCPFEMDQALGNCYLLQEKPREAMACYQRALKKRPDDYYSWQNLAKCHYDLEQHAKAAACFVKAYESSEEPKPHLLFYSGASYLSCNKILKGVEVLERLVSDHGDALEVNWLEALIQGYMQSEQQAKAIPIINKVIALTQGEKQKQWREALLQQYLALERLDEALAFARDLTGLEPTEPKWWKGLVHIHLTKKEYEKAFAALLVLDELAPLTPQDKQLAADLGASLGTPEKAVAYYAELAKEKPESKFFLHIVQCYQSMGDYENALIWINRGLKEFGGDDMRLAKANLLYSMEEYEESAKAFESLARSGGKAGQCWLNCGYAYQAGGKLADARKAFTQACKYKSSKKTAQKMLKTCL